MFKSIRSFWQGKRIIEINGKFIPQVRCFDPTALWHSVDRSCTDTWISKGTALDRCTVDTLEEANQNLYEFIQFARSEKTRKREEKRKSKQIVYLAEPEFWSALKHKEKNE